MKIPNIQNKDRILKAVREKNQITFRGKPIRISADFSIQTLKARRAWNNIFQALKENGCQPRILYSAKLTFKFDDEIKSFHDKQKLKEFTKRKPALQNILNKIFHEEEMKNKEANQNQIDHNTIILGDFNTPLSPLDRSSRQKLNKETIDLNNTINNLDLTDIYRIYHPTKSEYTFFSAAHGSFSKIDHILCHKANSNRCQKTEIMQCFL
uniref:Endonuclease/exonuclease/phosphatase domain-containing protein n=1 Tax=Sciurus vulgaris TaxID=55149 RepID=A0A8D2JMZ3_SCIVU